MSACVFETKTQDCGEVFPCQGVRTADGGRAKAEKEKRPRLAEKTFPSENQERRTRVGASAKSRFVRLAHTRKTFFGDAGAAADDDEFDVDEKRPACVSESNKPTF